MYLLGSHSKRIPNPTWKRQNKPTRNLNGINDKL